MNDKLKYALIIFMLSMFVRTAFVLYSTDPLKISDDSYHHLTIAQSLFKGRGFETEVIWPLILRSDSFPQPYFFRQPVYPYLIVSAYHVFGVSMFSAQLVNIVCESLIACLTFLLCLELTGARSASVYSAILYVFGSYQLVLAPQLLTETSFALSIIAIFYVVKRWDNDWSRCVAGCLIGASYLVREQGFILLTAIGAYIYARKDFGKAVRDFALIFFVALIVVSPWLLRTYLLTGNPFYNFNAYGILLLRDDDRYFAGIEPPKSPPELFIERLNTKTFIDILQNLLNLAVGHLILLPSTIMAIIIFMERGQLRVHIRENKSFYIAISTYYAVLMLVVSMMYGELRYLYSIIPFMAIISGVSLDAFFKNQINIFKSSVDDAFRAMIIVLLICSNVYFAIQVIQNTKPIPDIEAAYWLKGAGGEGSTVMGYFPYYVPYVLQGKAVQTPADRAELGPLIKHYNVTYVIEGVTEGWYEMDGEGYMRMVGEGRNWRVYGVVGGG
ncbi:MAG: glycosyltransferase family 39 protein [Candidatus Altiarchaeota archaeon]